MIKTPIHTYLDKFKVNNNINPVPNPNNPNPNPNSPTITNQAQPISHNVLSQPSIHCKSGKWFVPKDNNYKCFLDTISNTLINNKSAELHFLEVPSQKNNMCKVDIDLRFKATEDEIKNKTPPQRRYNDDLIELIIKILTDNINKIIDIPQNYKIYIQEKLLPRIIYQEQLIKDGIHIIIPNIVLSNKALYYLRDEIVANRELIEHLKLINNITDTNNVIDKRIIYPNAWYIYGCGKPDDRQDVYKVTNIYDITKTDATDEDSNEDDDDDDESSSSSSICEYTTEVIQSTNTINDYIYMFSNYNKVPNVKYKLDFIEKFQSIINSNGINNVFDDSDNNNSSNGSNGSNGSNNFNSLTYIGKESEAIYRTYAQDQGNFRHTSNLTQDEIKPYLECLKASRIDDYDEWCRVGLSLFNMDHRNYDLWKTWSMKSNKFDVSSCQKKWYIEFPKAGKYNMGFSKIKELARHDNIDKFNQIININKKNFFIRWIHAHITEKDIHSKSISISTMTHFIHSYIMDYAVFNIACALPGSSIACVYYKFDKHKWSKDEGANKVYILLSENIKNEINNIYLELKERQLHMERVEQDIAASNNNNRDGSGRGNGGNGGNGDDDNDAESVASYEKYIADNRRTPANNDQLSTSLKDKMYIKQQIDKCSELIQFLSKPANKKTIIEDLSQKCYDEDFYKKLDDNHNVLVCNNGVLDFESCIFRDGQPSDMMSISCCLAFPKKTDTFEAQEIMCAIQDWLDKIFPDDEVQAYILNIFAHKLSGKSIGEKFHIFTGSGANGKSQFFKLIKEVYGDNYQQSDNSLITTPRKDANTASPALAQLKAKRIVVMSEPRHDQPLQPSIIKELTGGDPLTCRHLNKDPIQFIPQFTIFLQCNDIPKNETTDDGFWRRVCIVPCESKFVIKGDDEYKLNDSVKYPNHFIGLDQSHMYKDWAPYFLYLLFERYKALKANNFKYSTPDKITIATRKYQDEANMYTDFFNQKVEEAPGYKVDLITLYTEFQQFVGRDFKTIKSTFMTQMERLIGKAKGKTKEYHGFRILGTTGEQIEPVDSNI